MANAIPNTTGIGRAIGCDYLRSRNYLIFVEVNGRLSRIDLRTHAYAVLGFGFDQPEDLVVSEDERYVYVTERAGVLVRVPLATPDRCRAVRIAGGMAAPHLLAIDEASGYAWVVEHAESGRLLRIDLTSGEIFTVVAGLEQAIGLLMTRDMRFAYLSERTNSAEARVLRIDLETGRRETLDMDASHPSFLTWLEADAALQYGQAECREASLRDMMDAGSPPYAL